MANLRALVTGGSRGIGKAIVCDLVAKGVDVTFTFNNSADVSDQLCNELKSLHPKISIDAIRCNLSDRSDCSEFCEKLSEHQFDVVIHNAGKSNDAITASVDLEKSHETMQLNYWSFVEMVKHTIRPMLQKKQGRFIVISSIAGLQGNKGNGIYASTKAALNAYVRVIATEYGRKGITANAIAPGFVKTDMINAYADQLDKLKAANPSRRLAEVNEVAELVTFLATSNGSYINGETISIDGGATNCL